MGIANQLRACICFSVRLGPFGAIRWWAIRRWLHRLKKGAAIRLSSRGLSYPVVARAHTSDINVFRQIFIDLEYSCIDDLKDVELVIDCGANVGYSSCYMLSRFMKAKVIAVEPDPENYELLLKNLRAYDDRVTTLCAGVWSHVTTLRLRDEPYRDGGKWAMQVEECEAGSPRAFSAIDIMGLLEGSGFDRISLLKIDVEGAEVVIFSDGCERWIERTDNIVIEIHDDSVFGPATNIVVDRIMTTGRFTMTTSGELTVFKAKHCV